MLFITSRSRSQAWCCIPVIPALGQLRQEDHEFEVTLSYIVRTYIKEREREREERKREREQRKEEKKERRNQATKSNFLPLEYGLGITAYFASRK
jgi:hypothetical protein